MNVCYTFSQWTKWKLSYCRYWIIIFHLDLLCRFADPMEIFQLVNVVLFQNKTNVGINVITVESKMEQDILEFKNEMQNIQMYFCCRIFWLVTTRLWKRALTYFKFKFCMKSISNSCHYSHLGAERQNCLTLKRSLTGEILPNRISGIPLSTRKKIHVFP